MCRLSFPRLQRGASTLLSGVRMESRKPACSICLCPHHVPGSLCPEEFHCVNVSAQEIGFIRNCFMDSPCTWKPAAHRHPRMSSRARGHPGGTPHFLLPSGHTSPGFSFSLRNEASPLRSLQRLFTSYPSSGVSLKAHLPQKPFLNFPGSSEFPLFL